MDDYHFMYKRQNICLFLEDWAMHKYYNRKTQKYEIEYECQ